MMIRNLFTTSLVLGTAMMMSACGRTNLPVTYRSLPQTVNAQTAQSKPVQLIVRFNQNVSRMALQAFNQKYNLQTVNYIPQLNAYVMSVRSTITSQAALTAMVTRMQQEPVTAMVEVNHEIMVAPIDYDMTIQPIFEQQ